jgi:hypothetical protein
VAKTYKVDPNKVNQYLTKGVVDKETVSCEEKLATAQTKRADAQFKFD